MNHLSLKDRIVQIPSSFYSRASFIICMLFIGTLPATMIYIALFWDNMQGILINTCGILSQLLIFLYIIAGLLKADKSELKAFFKLRAWDILLLVFLILCVISAILAEDKDLAIMGTGYRSEGITMYFVYASLYICGRLITDQKQQRILLISYGAAIAFLSIMTILQCIPALSSSLGIIGHNLTDIRFIHSKFATIYPNTNHYAYVLNMAIVGLAGLSYFAKGWKKYALVGLFGFNLWALIINNTFGCYLAAIGGLGFLVILFLIRDKKTIRHSILLIAIFAALSVTTSALCDGVLFNNFFVLKNDLETMDDSAGSKRLGLWRQAFIYIEEKPLFGHGPEGLHYKYFEDGLDNDRPHNEYIQHAAFHGIPALCAYLGALITLLVYCLKKLPKLSNELIVIGGIIFAYCVSAFFGNTMYNTTIYYYIFLGILSTCHINTKGTA